MSTLATALTQDMATVSLAMRDFSFTDNPKMFETAYSTMQQAEKRIADLAPQAKEFSHIANLNDVLVNAPRLFQEYRSSLQTTRTLSDTAVKAVQEMDAIGKDVINSLAKLQQSITELMRDSLNLGDADAVRRRYLNLSLVNALTLRIQDVRLLLLEARATKDMAVFDKLAAITEQNNETFATLEGQLKTPKNRDDLLKVLAEMKRYRAQLVVMREAWQKDRDVTAQRLQVRDQVQAIVDRITRDSSDATSRNALKTAEANEAALSFMLLMLGGVLLLGVIVSVALTRIITGPIRKNVVFAQAVANGRLDEHLDYRGTDELGALSDALRWMVEALKNRIAEAQEQSEQARLKGNEAHTAMETARAAQREAENAKREGMLAAADRLEGVTGVLSSASEQLRAQLSHAERGAHEQAARMAETATAMQQMNATVLEVARNAGTASEVAAQTRHRAEEGEKIVRQALQSITTVQEQSLSLKSDMAELGDTTRSISEIMGVISDIADQTNLLALNAAIEAARAGEAGRGFAVVADEVRKLAEKTMTSTTDVANAIRAIQQSAEKNMAQVDTTVLRIEEATAFAKKSGETLTDIVRMVDSAADQVRAIATASEQQSASSEQINQTIEQVNHITTATAGTMRESSDAVQSLARQAQELSGLITEMKRG